MGVKMSSQISILSCIILIGIICCVHGRESKPFGSKRGDNFKERRKVSPININGVKFPVEKNPAKVPQTVQE